MFQKPIFTRILIASEQISGFTEVLEKLKKWAIVNGLSYSTIENYSRKLADLSLYFKKLPEKISEDELRDYLAK